MKKLLLPLAILALAAPIAGCDQNKHGASIVKQRVLRGVLRGAGHEGVRGARHHGLRRVCAADIQKYCQTEDRGRARRQCLQSHLDQLSADCKTAVEQRGRGRRRRDFNDDSD